MSAREWKPGDVALVTTEFGGPCASVRQGGDVWVCRHGKSEDARVLEARPLVVIDPEDREQVERLTRLLREQSEKWLPPGAPTKSEVQRALREFANPQPPKPDEPTGLGAVVEDAEGDRWMRTHLKGAMPWTRLHQNPANGWHVPSDPRRRAWGSVNAVEVVQS